MNYYSEELSLDIINMAQGDMMELDLDTLETCQEVTDFSFPLMDSDQDLDMLDLVASSFCSPFAPMPLDNLEAFDLLFPSTQEEEPQPSGISQLKQLLLSRPNAENNPPSALATGGNVVNYSKKPGTRQSDRNKLTHNLQSSENFMMPLVSPENITETKSSDETAALSPITETERKPAAKALKFPPCFICGGNASGLHYGVNSCEACKGFFRRYLIRNEEYTCTKGGTCTIVNRNRENCSGCRLQKCFSLGMSKNKSKLGRYTLSRRTETIQQVNKLEGKNGDDAIKGKATTHFSKYNVDTKRGNNRMLGPKLNKDSNGITPKDRVNEGFVADLVNAMDEIKPYGSVITSDEQVNSILKFHYERYKTKISVYGEMKSVPMAEYYKLLKEYGIDIDGRLQCLKSYIREIERVTAKYCSFAKIIPGFVNLPRKDQSNLLKASRCDFFLILQHEAYHHEYRVIMTRQGIAYHVEEIADKCFSRELITNICETYRRWQTLNLNKAEKALLIAVTLFCTDRCSLENNQGVDNIQTWLLGLLRAQLEKTCPTSAQRRFYKIVDYLTSMRDSSELYSTEYKQLCKDEMVIEEVPMMTKFLPEED